MISNGKTLAFQAYKNVYISSSSSILREKKTQSQIADIYILLEKPSCKMQKKI